MALKLTSRDVCEVSGYSKEELRALSTAISFHKHRRVQPRVACEYTRHDLLVVAVIRELEVSYGLRRSVISEIYKPLMAALLGPKAVNRQARLHITVKPPTVTYVDKTIDIADGILLGLRYAFDRVDAHFGAYTDAESTQGNLRLAPVVVRPRRKNATSSK